METAAFRFLERRFPSANGVLVAGGRPVLVDTGYGSDADETEALLAAQGVPAGRLALVVNTHHHSDHVGGNARLGGRHGVPVAAHRWEGGLVNRRHPEVGAAEWLDQPIEPYAVDRLLDDGDEIDAGGVVLEVVHTPGHTTGHVALFARRQRVLVAGDAFHGRDVGWINDFREGLGSVERSLDSLDRLAALGARQAYSGHGPAIDDPAAAIDAARRRHEGWLRHPEKAAWHAVKRIFAYALMLHGGIAEAEVGGYLLARGWFRDYARWRLGGEPEELVAPLVDEMLRSGGVERRDGALHAATPHTPPPEGWYQRVPWPRDWPAAPAEEG